MGQVFGGDVESLLKELKLLGFEARLHLADKARLAFAGLQQLRSFTESKPGPGALCYLEKLPKDLQQDLWDFFIIEDNPPIGAKLDASKITKPGIIVRKAAAVADVIARKQWPRDWTGETEIPINAAKLSIETAVVIGPDCEIGNGTVLETGCRIGRGVRIGKNSRIGAYSRIGDFCEVGDHCELASHVAIGGQGFGFVHYPQELRPRPRRHLGRVIIGNNVRIGSHVSVDRGVFEDSRVGEGTALDNIVQVAHNSTIGRDGVICSFVGLSGSTEVGDRVTIAGMVGTKGHVRIGDDVTVAAQSGVSKDIADGQVVKGYPPRPLNEALELQTLFLKLPEIYRRLKDLEKKGTS